MRVMRVSLDGRQKQKGREPLRGPRPFRGNGVLTGGSAFLGPGRAHAQPSAQRQSANDHGQGRKVSHGRILAGASARCQRAIAHAARWLDAGSASIELVFDASALAGSAVRPPYELRDLRLVNQADMSLVERRERAAILR